MAKLPRTPFTPAEVDARRVQLDHDQAALFLVRRAIQLEVTAVRAGEAGNLATAKTKMGQARVLRAGAEHLVMGNRPGSLGVPKWLAVGTMNAEADHAPA